VTYLFITVMPTLRPDSPYYSALLHWSTLFLPSYYMWSFCYSVIFLAVVAGLGPLNTTAITSTTDSHKAGSR
jgi:hypothetical protein